MLNSSNVHTGRISKVAPWTTVEIPTNLADGRPIVLFGGGVPIKGDKILIPKQLWTEVLEALHSAHPGVNGITDNVRQRLFWPVLDTSIGQTKVQCQGCNSIAPSRSRNPLRPRSNTDFPFQKTVTDLFDLYGKSFMMYEDLYSSWIEVALLPSGKATAICNALKSWFCTYGAPVKKSSNEGPPFNSFIPGRLWWRETLITRALPTEQWPRRTGRSDSQRNADGLHQWLRSPTLRSGGTSQDDAQKYAPSARVLLVLLFV